MSEGLNQISTFWNTLFDIMLEDDLLNHFGAFIFRGQGGNSQNFLRKFVRFFLRL